METWIYPGATIVGTACLALIGVVAPVGLHISPLAVIDQAIDEPVERVQRRLKSAIPARKEGKKNWQSSLFKPVCLEIVGVRILAERDG